MFRLSSARHSHSFRRLEDFNEILPDALLEFQHMKRRDTYQFPFLSGLQIEPENPWMTERGNRKLRRRSELVTLELCAGAGAKR